MIKLGDGRVALLGYTALDRVIDAWGEHQHWLLFDTGDTWDDATDVVGDAWDSVTQW